MGICTLYFVRHGESEANAGIANQPDHEIILTATGQSQARQLVERLDVYNTPQKLDQKIVVNKIE